MIRQYKIKPPFFELGPKAYLFGEESVALAEEADRVGKKYDVSIIYTPQYVDIPRIVKETDHIHVFAQHMDSINIGRGIGSVLPEALVNAGAKGVLLNHAEKRLTLTEINKSIKRADEVGLVSIVCADTPEETAAVAHLAPNIIIVESPELIGGGKRDKNDMNNIAVTENAIKAINSNISVIHGAGISCGQDVYDIIIQGADGTGSTSGVIKAANPFAMLEEMISAVREAYEKRTKK